MAALMEHRYISAHYGEYRGMMKHHAESLVPLIQRLIKSNISAAYQAGYDDALSDDGYYEDWV
jgi:hypothetical protein